MKNLIRYETCFTRDHKSTIDLILTNKPKSFQNTCITETGLSNFHKLISTFFKTQITCLKTKIVFYCNNKHFEDRRFLEDFSQNFHLKQMTRKKIYNFITEKFLDAVNRHALLTKKMLRGNQAPFMNKKLMKEIYTRSKLKNKYNI